MSKFSTEKLIREVYRRDKVRTALAALSLAATLFAVIVFACLVVCFAAKSAALLIGCLVTLGAPFALVTLLRKAVKASRPYEVYDLAEYFSGEKRGNSFPSRHSFSIFAIGTLCLFASVPVGIVALVFGLLLCFCRVALGFHFVRDVVAGALIGIICSLLGGVILIL